MRSFVSFFDFLATEIMSHPINLKLAVLVLTELALFAVFGSYQSAAFGDIFSMVGALVGAALLLIVFLLWRFRNPKIAPVAIRKSGSFIVFAVCLGNGGFLFPLALGPHATLGILFLGLVAQIVCLSVASYFVLVQAGLAKYSL